MGMDIIERISTKHIITIIFIIGLIGGGLFITNSLLLTDDGSISEEQQKFVNSYTAIENTNESASVETQWDDSSVTFQLYAIFELDNVKIISVSRDGNPTRLNSLSPEDKNATISKSGLSDGDILLVIGTKGENEYYITGFTMDEKTISQTN